VLKHSIHEVREGGNAKNQNVSLTFTEIKNQKRGDFKYSMLVLSDLFREDAGSRPLE
jgi:hypothetical protein